MSRGSHTSGLFGAPLTACPACPPYKNPVPTVPSLGPARGGETGHAPTVPRQLARTLNAVSRIATRSIKCFGPFLKRWPPEPVRFHNVNVCPNAPVPVELREADYMTNANF